MRKDYAVIGALWAVAALFGGLALRALDLGQTPWLISRASGIVAFALLSASVVFGLLLSTRLARRWQGAKGVFEAHNFLSVLTLTFISLHAGALLFDGFFNFTPLSILVPFMSPYEPLWVALGVFGGWATALVVASSHFRKRLGHTRWRRLHYVSFLAYLTSFGHGVTAGTDTELPAVTAMYVVSGLAVFMLLAIRFVPLRAATPVVSRTAG